RRLVRQPDHKNCFDGFHKPKIVYISGLTRAGSQMQALVSRKKIVFTRRYVFNTIIALIRPLQSINE
ncbi:TPA: hypothetical protein ACXG0B_004337, partial [Escherichia coli]